MDFNEKMPAVSVVIPMYNSEKYIGQCIRSIISQTFTNFELIIVDDCSTDNSAAIVTSFLNAGTKIAARLVRLKKNSGGAAIPRNIGMKLARGKYIAFVDSDDMFLPNALQILIDAAVKFDADVVHTEVFTSPIDKENPFNIRRETYQVPPFVEAPTLETNNIIERIQKFINRGYMWNVWSKLFRRDFLIENQIEFANARTIEDMIFVFDCISRAPRYVRIPDAVYVYRVHEESITNSKLPLEQQVKRYVPSLVRGIKALERSLERQQFFINNPQYKLPVVQFLSDLHMIGEMSLYQNHSPFEIEPLIRAEFAAEPSDGSEIVMSYLLQTVNLLNARLMQAQDQLRALQSEPQNTLPAQ